MVLARRDDLTLGHIDDVMDDGSPLFVAGKNGRGAVIMSIEEWRGIAVTEEFKRNGMYEILVEASKEKGESLDWRKRLTKAAK